MNDSALEQRVSLAGAPSFDAGYRRYVLGMLTLVYTLNFVDRNLLILLLQPIKEDLRLSDTQLGFLTGIAFGLFYATLGLPIARWADRGNRVTLTSIAIALWGVTVMACLVVTNFVQLVCARIAAAIGEAGCMPPTSSLIGDYFPAAAQRARAMSVYWLGAPLSALVSFVVGGWLSVRYGWRLTFFVMGVPALVVAVVVKMTVAEPRASGSDGLLKRRAAALLRAGAPIDSDGMATDSLRGPHASAELSSRPGGAAPLGIRQVVGILWNRRAARNLACAIILYYMLGLGLAPWYAAFMMRSHGMGTVELGVWLGLLWSIGGAAGMLLGGQMAAKWFASDERGQMRLTAVMIGSLVPCYTLFLLLPQKPHALVALTVLAIVTNFFFGPTFALMQRLVPDETRATTLAVVMLLANLIGMGLGPQLVGILSDLLLPRLGADSLRYAMLALSFVALWSAFHFWRVSRTVGDDLAMVKSASVQ